MLDNLDTEQNEMLSWALIVMFENFDATEYWEDFGDKRWPEKEDFLLWIKNNLDDFQHQLDGYFDSPGFEMKFGNNVYLDVLLPLLSLEYEEYEKVVAGLSVD